MTPRTLPTGWVLLTTALLAISGAAAIRAADDDLVLHVRSEIEELGKPASKSGVTAKPTERRAQTFAMVPAVEVASGDRLVRPLDGGTLNSIYALLQEKLTARGYVGVQGREKPELAITIRYGRGILTNPYSDYASLPGNTATPTPSRNSKNSTAVASVPSVAIVGLVDLKHFEVGRQAKLQAANQEKLFFTIEAWEFESWQKGRKPKRLWSTTICVDDPDHRDLGQIYREMITAGAGYFNRRTEKEEAEVYARVRGGRVEIGDTRVVEESKAAK